MKIKLNLCTTEPIGTSYYYNQLIQIMFMNKLQYFNIPRYVTLLVSAFYLLSIVLQAQTQILKSNIKSKAGIIESGEFHGDEITAKNGEQWLGLFCIDQACSFRPTTIKVKRVADPVVDEGSSARTGKAVSVTDKVSPIFLTRGIDVFKSASVTTILAGDRILSDSTNMNLTLGKTIYKLQVITRNLKKENGLISNDAKLILSVGSVSQLLYELKGDGREFVDQSWKLI